MKKKNCKICGEYSGKRNVCLSCKEKYPFKPSGKGTNPFDRKKEFEKEKKLKKKWN